MRCFFRSELDFYLKEAGFELIDNLDCANGVWFMDELFCGESCVKDECFEWTIGTYNAKRKIRK